MKNYLSILLLLIVSCNTKNEKATPNEAEEATPATAISKDVHPIDPCTLLKSEQLATMFNIVNDSAIETYTRDMYGTTKQCQFIWQEEKGSVKGSQLLVIISSKEKDAGATFSKMLQLDIENGLSASENGEVINIKPTPLQGFGDNAYHWTQPNFQNVQKIVFQVNNDYKVEIMFNCHKEISIDQEDIKNKLIETGTLIKGKL